jgi:hypothetical protein
LNKNDKSEKDNQMMKVTNKRRNPIKLPLYSIPHFSLTMTGFPVKLFKNGLGLTGTVCSGVKKHEQLTHIIEGISGTV